MNMYHGCLHLYGSKKSYPVVYRQDVCMCRREHGVFSTCTQIFGWISISARLVKRIQHGYVHVGGLPATLAMHKMNYVELVTKCLEHDRDSLPYPCTIQDTVTVIAQYNQYLAIEALCNCLPLIPWSNQSL